MMAGTVRSREGWGCQAREGPGAGMWTWGGTPFATVLHRYTCYTCRTHGGLFAVAVQS